MRWMIAIIVIGFGMVLLATSTVTKPSRPGSGPVTIAATPLVLDSDDPSQTRAGPLQYLGGWELKGRRGLFGGLSSMLIRPDGKIWALSDGGVMFTFPQPMSPGLGQATVLRYKKPRKHWMPRPTDSESIVADPEFRHIWVGYEMVEVICRYTTDLAHIGKCRAWPEMEGWPEAESLESMVRLPDGRFLVIAEGEPSRDGGRAVLLFSGDPVEKTTPRPIHMTYIPPPGYNPTDALWIGDNQILVLNRRATLYDGFTAVIKLIDLGAMKPGAVLGGREIARLAPPLLSDNYEGLALEQRNGQRILWVVSDDNYLFFQRTLLLKFALPEHF
ncbi:MAG TPA: esterase-like activity of phytase family protein [Sphingobium sp.]|nr:esterase-like activity of phytase family protein [Sphingobium sp.]